jgi:hypothetical protein
MSVRVLTFLVATTVLLASGIICHALAGDSAQLDDAAARVALVPKEVGDWRGHDETPDEQAFAMTGAKGFWMRTYVNGKTRDSVLAILMCGRPGKMAVHTPEVCYRGAGFELREQPTQFVVKANREAPSQLWTASFLKRSGDPVRLRLYWAWNSRGEWEAPSTPRWQFRGEPFLYKLYVSRENSQQPNASAQVDPAADFLRAFVPVLNETLFARADGLLAAP